MMEEDLMIGDWVKMNAGPARITAIKEGEIHFVDRFGRGISPCCEGLPLTAEILEKNGFESDTNMFGLCDYELSKSYILENRGDRFCFVKRFPGHLHSTFHVIDVKYVHELQHALRLCGISKDITL